jgi:hypothetical protein
MKRFLFKINYWFKHEFRYYHKDFVKGVKNLWRWFPLIWKDRDWDDYYIWVLLEKKLKNQADYIGGRGRHLNANRDAERMMTCVKLMERIRDEYYMMEYVDYQKSEFHFDPVPDRPNNKQLRIEEISDNLEDYFKKYPRIYKKVCAEFSVAEKRRYNKRKTAIYVSRENHNRARKLLFKLMEQHIESWWD